MKRLIIGTRGSALALRQAETVQAMLKAAFPDLEVAIQVVRTTGDHITDVPLARIGGKGLFVKEIEEALLDGRCDIAVHSLKDVPDLLPDGLCLAAFLPREIPFDAFVSEEFDRFMDLPEGARVGTSSLRRASLIRAVRPDLEVLPLRGNVDTRLRKLREGLDAVVLAGAGLRRLGLEDRVREYLTPPDFIPAVGQGVIAVECRKEGGLPSRLGRVLGHPETTIAVQAERAFLREVGGGCQVPLGALATVNGGKVEMVGMIAKPDGSKVLRGHEEGSIDEAEKVGRTLARRLLDLGGYEILEEVRKNPPWGKK